MKTLIVDEKYNGKKLNNFLFDNFNGLASSTFFKALRNKDIKINGKRVNENVTLFIGDEICVYILDEYLFKKINIDIIYEDENILLINKSSGISVTGEHSLTTVLQGKYNSSTFPSPCHRLDTNTSGIVVFAKNEEALNILFEKFKTREIEKYYSCICIGTFNKKSDTLNSYLFKDSKKSIVYISDIPKKGYQNIITSYNVLKENKKKDLSLLDVELKTGRTHQIRAHLAHIGHPILGDRKIWNKHS